MQSVQVPVTCVHCVYAEAVPEHTSRNSTTSMILTVNEGGIFSEPRVPVKKGTSAEFAGSWSMKISQVELKGLGYRSAVQLQ